MKNENELKKMQRASLLKMGVIAAIVIIFIVFSSMHMQIKQMTAETA